MVTITWENKETKQTKIQIFKSKDKLEDVLSQLKGKKDEEKVFETKEGKKKVFLVIKAVSYETKSEKALFRQYRCIPKASDYPYDLEEDEDD